MAKLLHQFVQMGHLKTLTKKSFDWGEAVGGTRYKALRFFTIVFFFIVAVKTYQSSAAAATAAVLVREVPPPDPLPLCPGLLSDPPPRLRGFWGHIPHLPLPQQGQLLASVFGHTHCVRYYGRWPEPGWMIGEGYVGWGRGRGVPHAADGDRQ